MNTQKQNGFTLIELMIVVAIIGILASIALPAYQQYTAKSAYTEVVMATTGVKAAIEVCAQTQNGLKNCTEAKNKSVNAAVAGATGPDNVASVATSNASATNITITATAAAAANSTNGLDGETYVLIATMAKGAVKWALDTSNSTCSSKGYC